MYRAVEASVRRGGNSGLNRVQRQRTLLLVAPGEGLPESLVHAVERELNWVTVEQVATVADACVEFEHPVSLILLDIAVLRDAEAYASELARVHPSAISAVMQEQAVNPVAIAEMLASPVVRGVLPMNLKLDVWLSIVRLMLRGGEYYPITLLQTQTETAHTTEFVTQSNGARSGSPEQFPELTDRELQILKLVSRGSQNKLIAAALALSEHTVKIHLHNIINKLGVHNRTEAAAIFHQRHDRHRSRDKNR